MITIVTGLPRSGTSLMMQLLEAGGMPVLTDLHRAADHDNPNGYYEYEPVKRLRQDSSWLSLAEGKAVKIVYALLPDLPPAHEYRIILMRRDIHEVLASQAAMLQRRGAPGAKLSHEALADAFTADLARVLAQLPALPNVQLLEIEHRDCITSPATVADQLNDFLGGKLDTRAMLAIPRQALYRRRAT